MLEPRQITTDEDGRIVYAVCDRRVMVRTNDTKWRVLLEGGKMLECGKAQAVCVCRKNLYVAGQKGDGKILKFTVK
nr:hypothetical protein BaRGS_019430 [Batillaria attramentaria]